MADLNVSNANEDGLKVLVDAKVLNPNITLSQLLDVTKRLSGGSDGKAATWAFIVKDKYVFKDDTPAQTKSVANWPQE